MFDKEYNSVINSATIGNGGAYNLMNLLGYFHLNGGIKRYTLQRGYFLNNISNNFSEGTIGRYDYGGSNDFIQTDGKKLDGNDLVPAELTQDRVGDFYTTQVRPRNNEKKFMTIETFSLLGEKLRERAINANFYTNGTSFREKYKDVSGADKKFIASGVTMEEIGSDADILYGNYGFLPKSGLTEQVAKIEEMIEAKRLDKAEQDGNYAYYNAKPSQAMHEGDYTELKRAQDVFSPQVSLFGAVEISMTKRDILDFGNQVRTRYNESFWSHHPNSLIKEKIGNVGTTINRDIRDLAAIGSDFNDAILLDQGSHAELLKELSAGLYYYTPKIHGNNFGRNSLMSYNTWTKDNQYGIVYSAYDDYKVPESFNNQRPSHSGGTLDERFKTYLRERTQGTNGAVYTYYHEVDMGSIPESIETQSTMDGFVASLINDSNGKSNKRLTAKTDEYFRQGRINSLINRFHTKGFNGKDDLITAAHPTFGLSRGRNLLRKEYENGTSGDKSTGFDNPYCRVWTAHHQYSRLKDRIRPFMDGENPVSLVDFHSKLDGLRPDPTLFGYSVLQDNGFVKITPHKKDGKLDEGSNELKRYMFSIENLAWKGFAKDKWLSKEQIGPNGGRIMWFPPYNLKFTENINTTWKDNDFIGRGEKIYTYVNTERGGTLNFTMLIDHPSIINKMEVGKDKDEAERDLLRFFAGCGELELKTEPTATEEEVQKEVEKDNNTPSLDSTEQYEEVQFVVFFPNNFSGVDYRRENDIEDIVAKIDTYEMTKSGAAPFTEMDSKYSRQILEEGNYDNESEYALNTMEGVTERRSRIKELLETHEDVKSYEEFKNLKNYFTTDNINKIFGLDASNFEIDKIICEGFASDHGYKDFNMALAENRQNTIKALAKYFYSGLDESKFETGRLAEISVKEGLTNETDINELDAKIARSAAIRFCLKLKIDAKPVQEVEEGMISEKIVQPAYGTNDARLEGPRLPDGTFYSDGREVGDIPVTINGNGNEMYFKANGDKEYTYQNEFLYFEHLETENPMVHKNIVDKIRFFEPAFHSITPEGFNARLNFLQQCTRQGPTVGSHAGRYSNNEDDNIRKAAGNLAFGMAPYCILRIGDFYYSKICITSISIDYDTGGGVQWDLNPEGVGVQPMMANISVNFNFIGGQNIDGPVAELQNAITANYYANSSLYTNNMNNINGI